MAVVVKGVMFPDSQYTECFNVIGTYLAAEFDDEPPSQPSSLPLNR